MVWCISDIAVVVVVVPDSFWLGLLGSGTERPYIDKQTVGFFTHLAVLVRSALLTTKLTSWCINPSLPSFAGLNHHDTQHTFSLLS